MSQAAWFTQRSGKNLWGQLWWAFSVTYRLLFPEVSPWHGAWHGNPWHLPRHTYVFSTSLCITGSPSYGNLSPTFHTGPSGLVLNLKWQLIDFSNLHVWLPKISFLPSFKDLLLWVCACTRDCVHGQRTAPSKVLGSCSPCCFKTGSRYVFLLS